MSLILADVSEFQTVDWATYGAHNPAVIVRAHNGFRADYKWAQNRDGSRAHCQWRGFYQYLPASVDPRAAARAFAATTGTLLPGELAILDLEEGVGDQDARRAAWLDELHAAVEWTYSGLIFARNHLPGVRINWIAAYGSTEPIDAHDLWQFSSSASFAGIPGNVDASRFNGTLADLEALTKGTDMAITQDDAVAVWTEFPIVKDMRAADPDTAPRVAPSAMLEYGAQEAEQALLTAQAVAKQVATLAATVAALEAQVAALPDAAAMQAAAAAGAAAALDVKTASVTLNVTPTP